jgi:hypothetical protein
VADDRVRNATHQRPPQLTASPTTHSYLLNKESFRVSEIRPQDLIHQMNREISVHLRHMEECLRHMRKQLKKLDAHIQHARKTASSRLIDP